MAARRTVSQLAAANKNIKLLILEITFYKFDINVIMEEQ